MRSDLSMGYITTFHLLLMPILLIKGMTRIVKWIIKRRSITKATEKRKIHQHLNSILSDHLSANRGKNNQTETVKSRRNKRRRNQESRFMEIEWNRIIKWVFPKRTNYSIKTSIKWLFKRTMPRLIMCTIKEYTICIYCNFLSVGNVNTYKPVLKFSTLTWKKIREKGWEYLKSRKVRFLDFFRVHATLRSQRS